MCQLSKKKCSHKKLSHEKFVIHAFGLKSNRKGIRFQHVSNALVAICSRQQTHIATI